jgi:phosphoglycerate dehydrogenase-like enzyme
VNVVYVLRNPGVAARTPAPWRARVVTARSDAAYDDPELSLIAAADALVVGLEPIPATLIEQAPRLRLIQRLGVGYCNVDVGAAAARGIPVCNMPDFNAATVAEHTIMLVLAVLRRAFESTLLLKAGRWPVEDVVRAGVHDLAGRTVGLLGLGAIGAAVAERLVPFGVELRFHDRRGPAASVHGARFAELDELLRASRVLSLHLPLTPATRGLLTRERLASLPPGAILVNTARGALVDEAALADALRSGALAGAGIDVFAEEPPPARHPLRTCPNVVLTPHLAGQTREAMERMVVALVENLRRVAAGEEPRYRVDP